MKILIIGSGAREHALAWKISQNPNIRELYVAPGNAGTLSLATNLNIKANDIEKLYTAAREKAVDLTIVGPEIPLASGIVDYFKKNKLNIFGPTRAAAQIESSKVFSKNLMQKYHIPCAGSHTFSEYTQAKKFVEAQKPPLVIKADGLAAGKGVIIANTREEALKALEDIMEKKVFGTAGDQVIIEEFLTGKEVSLLAFTDGKTVIPMVPACDYKRVFDNDRGQNTGGMGSYSPPNFFDSAMTDEVLNRIIKPVISAMAKEGMPYEGVLYTGLIITDRGAKVLEFNARFGDPETQAILPRLKSDLLSIMLAITEKRLHEVKIEWYNNACLGVVLASGGYPDAYDTGFPITGLNDLDNDIMIFHAGTRLDEKTSKIVTDGGRVITVTGTGKTMEEARNKVYKNISKIAFKDCHYRKDIALREVN